MTRYRTFDRSRLRLLPLARRQHDMTADDCLPLADPVEPFEHPEWNELIDRLAAARQTGRPIVLMTGAHPIKLGLAPFINDLIARGWITLVATNGAGVIHDFELAYFLGSTESVAHYIRAGQFGLWEETSRLNDLARSAAAAGDGLGETVGRTIIEELPPGHHLSVAAAAYRAGIPLTCHVGIGNDIVHEHPNCDGGAWGAASYTDFLILAATIEQLEGGAFLNVGTAVMGPEVYLKALAMARNVAHQQGGEIRRFTTAVFDLADLPPDWRRGTPGKDHPQYYYRPWKTILERTVADGGTSFFFRGDHRRTIPTLWRDLVQRESSLAASRNSASESS